MVEFQFIVGLFKVCKLNSTVLDGKVLTSFPVSWYRPLHLVERRRKITKPTGCVTDTATGQLTGTIHSVSVQQCMLFEIVSQQIISCGVGWYFFSDVSVQHVGPSLSVTTIIYCKISQDSKVLSCTSVEV